MQKPTERELEILEVLWEHEEATVREVYEQLRSRKLPIVQNTVQAFLRTMEDKGLVSHRVEGRSFVYRPLVRKQKTQSRIVSGILKRVFGGAVDQLVRSAFDAKAPTHAELDELEDMIAQARKSAKPVADGRKNRGPGKEVKGGGK